MSLLLGGFHLLSKGIQLTSIAKNIPVSYAHQILDILASLGGSFFRVVLLIFQVVRIFIRLIFLLEEAFGLRHLLSGRTLSSDYVVTLRHVQLEHLLRAFILLLSSGRYILPDRFYSVFYSYNGRYHLVTNSAVLGTGIVLYLLHEDI